MKEDTLYHYFPLIKIRNSPESRDAWKGKGTEHYGRL